MKGEPRGGSDGARRFEGERSSVSTGAAPKVVKNVELSGRLARFWTNTVSAAGVVLLLLLCWAYSGSEFWSTLMPEVLGGVAFILGVNAWVRWRALKATCRGWDMKPDGTLRAGGTEEDGSTAKPVPSGTIICCSGGGIKSASFCLGALQALSEAGAYRQAEAVVGVSGGGYIAGAYAALQYRATRSRQDPATPTGEDPAPVFAERSRELAALRRRTNYLASSARVGFDLVLSLLFGLSINLLIVGAGMGILAWLLVEQVRLDDLVKVDGSNWIFNPEDRATIALLWGPAVLILLSLLFFLITRYVRPQTRYLLANPGRRRIFRGSLAPQRKGADPTWDAWFSNTPNSLVLIAAVIVVLYPGVPYVACAVHDFWVTHSLMDWAGKLEVTTVLAVVTAFVALVRSAMKGTGQRQPQTRFGEVLMFFRQKVAPWLGVALAVAVGYSVLVALTAPYLPQPESSDLDLLWFGIAFLVLARAFVSANKTSMFPFYRSRLDFAFFQHEPQPQADGQETATPPPPGGAPAIGQRESSSPDGALVPSLADLAADTARGPELVLCATANVQDGDLLPSGRNGTTFILSGCVGFTDPELPGGAYRLPARDYQPGGRLNLDVATASAISGAAVSPLAGREDKSIGAYRLLLALANIRLGVWVRNPYWSAEREGRPWVVKVNDFLDRTSPFQVIQEALGTPSIYGPYLYLTDGGHYDNLGLVEALRRRPDRIIMLDGSGDPEDQFPAMGQAIATARMDLGIEVDFKPEPLKRGGQQYPQAGWVRANATYPRKPDGGDGGSCRIDYVKCVLPKGLSWDLESYRLQDEDFPTTSPKYELYDEFDFEAYRHLGWSLIKNAENSKWVSTTPEC